MIIDNDLLSMQYARIMAENAMEAQKKLATYTQEELDIIVEATVVAAETHIDSLSVMSHEETYAGNCQDKLTKNQFVCSQVRRGLRSMRCVGVIDENPTDQT